MKTLKVFLILLVLSNQVEVFAQDTIYVSYNKVTAIEFPSRITTPVSTSKYLLAQVKDEKFLSIKAVGKDFNESNLTVNTVDGMSYKFPVSFSYGRAGRVKRLSPTKEEESQKSEAPSPYTIISRKIISNRTLGAVSRDKSSKVRSELGRIAISGDDLFYRLKVKNRSHINFDIDFIRFYIRDIKTTKRTVTQEQEVYPVFTYGAEHETVAGKSSQVYVFALKKFPLAKDKALFIEVYEQDGGRHQYLKAKQSDIERATAIYSKNKQYGIRN